jgi:hypothetical protein
MVRRKNVDPERRTTMSQEPTTAPVEHEPAAETNGALSNQIPLDEEQLEDWRWIYEQR